MTRASNDASEFEELIYRRIDPVAGAGCERRAGIERPADLIPALSQ